jgi:hypothetical protein
VIKWFFKDATTTAAALVNLTAALQQKLKTTLIEL